MTTKFENATYPYVQYYVTRGLQEGTVITPVDKNTVLFSDILNGDSGRYTFDIMNVGVTDGIPLGLVGIVAAVEPKYRSGKEETLVPLVVRSITRITVGDYHFITGTVPE
jgi:hypothetical protein